MGWFGRNKTAVAETTWQPVGDVTPLLGADADMDDEGQAQPAAYQVVHENPAAPGARLTICTYVSYLPDDAGYCIGLRSRYTHEDDGDWSYTGYAADPDEDGFASILEANAEAESWARNIASNPAVCQEALGGVFDWDGEPFALAS